MSYFTMPSHRLHPGDRLLKGKLHLPDDLTGYLSGDRADRPPLTIEVHCDVCDQTGRYPYPDHGDPQTTVKMDLVVPVENPSCQCPPFYVGLNESRNDHMWKLGEFKKLVRAWEHRRASRRPEIQAIMSNNVRLRMDMLGYEF